MDTDSEPIRWNWRWLVVGLFGSLLVLEVFLGFADGWTFSRVLRVAVNALWVLLFVTQIQQARRKRQQQEREEGR